MRKRASERGETPEPAPRKRRFDRSEIIIDAAAEIFRRKGYDATSLQEIADEVGILKGSIYHYIDTKEDLLFAIIDRNHVRIIEGNQGWRDVEDVVDKIRAFIHGHILESLQHPTDSIVFVRDFRALSPERADLIVKRQADYDKEFRDLVTRGVAEGRLREGVTPAYASRAVFGMSNWIHYWYHADGRAKAPAVADELSTYALASLM